MSPADSMQATTQTMRAVCTAAVAAGAAIGAHVSYRDRDGFGRRALPVEAETVAAEAAEQIEALQAAAATCRRPGGVREAARRALSPREQRRRVRRRPRCRCGRREYGTARDARLPRLGAARARARGRAPRGRRGIRRSRLRARRDARAALRARVAARGGRGRPAGGGARAWPARRRRALDLRARRHRLRRRACGAGARGARRRRASNCRRSHDLGHAPRRRPRSADRAARQPRRPSRRARPHRPSRSSSRSCRATAPSS